MNNSTKLAIFATVSALAITQRANAAEADQDAGAPASAQTSNDSNAIDDIVVTAQKRSESVQRTAIAITAVGGEDLRNRQITTVSAIAQQVPNLNVTEQIGQARITMRGIGVDNISAASEGSIAFNVDGVFYSRSSAALGGFFDLERIEVLRGPQGTLYGRNATGGSVNLITKKPGFEGTNGYVTLTASNYGAINTEAAAGTSLSDKVAFRIAGQTQHHSGYGRNILSGAEIDGRGSQALRASLIIRPTDALHIELGADYLQSDDSSNSYHYFGPGLQDAGGNVIQPFGVQLGGQVPSNIRDVSSVVDPHAQSKFYGFRADISYDVSDSVTVRSLSAYRYSNFSLATDASPVGNELFPVDLAEKSDQFSQEFQLNIDSDRNKFVAGAYYLHETIDGFLRGPFNLQAVGGSDALVQGYYAGGRLKTDAFAIFGQDTYSVTDALRVTVGARYSIERKTVHDQADFDLARLYSPANISLVPFFDDKRTFKSFTPKIGLEYDLNPSTLFYASWSKGFKAGTYNLGSSLPALSPEKVDAYTAGFKTTAFDRKVRANIEGFYYKYNDLQVTKVRNFALVLENAATATIYGVEGEFTVRPIDAPLTLSLNASWLHARFDSYVTSDPARPGGDGVTFDPGSGAPAFNLRGKRLSQAPDYLINANAEYVLEAPFGNITLRAESTWSDRVYFSAFNRVEVSQAPYNLQNASIAFSSTDDAWRLTAFVRNIANKTIKASGQVATPFVGAPIIGFVQPPRTYGASLTYNF